MKISCAGYNAYIAKCHQVKEMEGRGWGLAIILMSAPLTLCQEPPWNRFCGQEKKEVCLNIHVGSKGRDSSHCCDKRRTLTLSLVLAVISY